MTGLKNNNSVIFRSNCHCGFFWSSYDVKDLKVSPQSHYKLCDIASFQSCTGKRRARQGDRHEPPQRRDGEIISGYNF